MTLGQLKQSVMQMCEEYEGALAGYDPETSAYNFTADMDLSNKLIPSINGAVADIATFVPLIKRENVFPVFGELPMPYYIKQVITAKVNGEVVPFTIEDDTLFFSRNYERVELTFEKIPTMFSEYSKNSSMLEFTDDVCQVLMYGVVADVLKISGNYEIFEGKYQSKLKNLRKPKKISVVKINRGTKQWGE